jgi:transposase
MGTTGSASEQEARRRLAVARVNEGGSQKDVAAFLGVSTRAVGKWMAAYRASGEDGLKARPRPGAKPKLSKRQEQAVLAWMARSPKAFGYPDGLWTTRRLAQVIEKKYKVRFNSNYLAAWLTRQCYTPQEPEVRAVERDEPAIARGVAEDWPRIPKKRGTSGHTSS